MGPAFGCCSSPRMTQRGVNERVTILDAVRRATLDAVRRAVRIGCAARVV
jgi:hypothetical protein